MKNIDVLCIGFGSSGRRYLRILNEFTTSNIVVLRRNLSVPIQPPTTDLEKSFTYIESDIPPDSKFDLIIISSPSSLHISDFESTLHHCHLDTKILIEKPLATSIADLNYFLKLSSERSV